MTLKNYTFLQICQMIIIPAFFDTLKMLVISGIISTILGFFLGVILIITEKGGLCRRITGTQPHDARPSRTVRESGCESDIRIFCKYDTVVSVYYFDDLDHSVYQIDRRQFHRGSGGDRSADSRGYAFYGAYFPE